MTKEQIFAAFAVNVAGSDGTTERIEAERVFGVARANGLDADAVLEACQAECDHPSNLVELAKEMSEEDKELVMFAAVRICVADGKVALKEMQRVYGICDLFGWGPAYATIEFLKQLRQEDGLQFEGVDF